MQLTEMNHVTEGLPEHDITDADTLVFLHLPKTAGLTLGNLIDPMWLPHMRAPVYMMQQLTRVPQPEIERARSFVGHFFLNALESFLARPLFVITLLREPFSRYVSAFHQMQREKTPLRPEGDAELQLIRAMNLEEFVSRSDLKRKNAITNLQTRYIALPFHLQELQAIPRMMRQENENPSPISIFDACQKLQALDCFGLTEHFQESLWMLCFVFGWYPIEDKVMLNRAPKPTDTQSVAPETLEQLRELNAKDLDLYAFAKPLFQERYVWLMETLRERYGSAHHARQPMPLADETMRELLLKHFQARHTARHHNRSVHSIRFTFFENAETAQGWHSLEKSPAWGAFRWTGPGTLSSLTLPRPADSAIELRFCVLHILKAELLDRLVVSANGIALPVKRTATVEGLNLYQTNIPHSVVRDSPFVHLEWHLPETVRPIDLYADNSDERELGVAVSWVELSPLAAPQSAPASQLTTLSSR